MNHHKRKFLTMRMLMLFCLSVLLLANIVTSKGLTVELVPVDADKMVIVPTESVDDAWRFDPNFIDTSWTPCNGAPGGVGFDRDGDYNEDITLDIGGMMHGTSCFIRTKFQLDENLRREFDHLVLKIRYDDGFVAYLNGEKIADANAPDNPGRWSAASQPHEAQDFINFDVSQYLDVLKSGENVLAIHGMNVSSGSPDLLIAFSFVARKNYLNNFESDLPIIVMQTPNSSMISSANGTRVSVGVIAGVGNTLHSEFNDYSGDVIINKRQQDFQYTKADYRMTISDGDASLLGMPAGDVWLLDGMYSDKTLMRNVIMGRMAHKMGRLSAVPRLCHLFINDAYEGIYVLREERNRHINRIDIAEASADDPSGGFILKMTGEHWLPGITSAYPLFYNNDNIAKYQYFYPMASSISSAQADYISGFIHGFENAVKNGEQLSDYQDYIDLSSFIDYFLLNEISRNVNAYRNRTTFYKNRDAVDPLLHIEPDFDFEHALGNINYYNGDQYRGWTIDYLLTENDAHADTLQPPFWWANLYDDAEFKKQVKRRWDMFYEELFSENAIIKMMDSLYTVLAEERGFNFEKWNVIGQDIEPNSYIGESFDDDFDHLYLWIIDRLEWMNNEIAGYQTTIEHTSNRVVDFSLEQNYPNPFNPTTRIRYQIPTEGFVNLVVYNVRGELVDTLVSGQQAAGMHSVEWDAGRLSGGLYFCKLNANGQQLVRRMVLLR